MEELVTLRNISYPVTLEGNLVGFSKTDNGRKYLNFEEWQEVGDKPFILLMNPANCSLNWLPRTSTGMSKPLDTRENLHIRLADDENDLDSKILYFGRTQNVPLLFSYSPTSQDIRFAYNSEANQFRSSQIVNFDLLALDCIESAFSHLIQTESSFKEDIDLDALKQNSSKVSELFFEKNIENNSSQVTEVSINHSNSNLFEAKLYSRELETAINSSIWMRREAESFDEVGGYLAQFVAYNNYLLNNTLSAETRQQTINVRLQPNTGITVKTMRSLYDVETNATLLIKVNSREPFYTPEMIASMLTRVITPTLGVYTNGNETFIEVNTSISLKIPADTVIHLDIKNLF